MIASRTLSGASSRAARMAIGLVVVAAAIAGCGRDPGKDVVKNNTTSPPIFSVRNNEIILHDAGMYALQCYEQIPDSTGPGGGGQFEWYYCAAGADGHPGIPQILPPGRTAIEVGSQTLVVHPVETVHTTAMDKPVVMTIRRVDMPKVNIKVQGLDLLGRPGYRIGYGVRAGEKSDRDRATVFHLTDPATNKTIGLLFTMIRPVGARTTLDGYPLPLPRPREPKRASGDRESEEASAEK